MIFLTEVIKWLFGRGHAKPKEAEREWLIWVGDGLAPAGPHLIGCLVDLNGRVGKVVDTTFLKILVEWEK